MPSSAARANRFFSSTALATAIRGARGNAMWMRFRCVGHVYALELLGLWRVGQTRTAVGCSGAGAGAARATGRGKDKRADFVGLSWGGEVVQGIAIRFPERVNRLVLVDSIFDSSMTGWRALAEFKRRPLLYGMKKML